MRTTADAYDRGFNILGGGLSLGQLWWVPAVTIGGPGLLVILFVALQLAGGIIWLPATRRFRRDGPQRSWSIVTESAD